LVNQSYLPGTGERRFLCGTAAVNGAAIMIVEILGAKMLSPYFGTSHFVWTAQIAVTLVALACGYYLGGRWVDASPRPAKLYVVTLAAGFWLAATVGLTAKVALGFFGGASGSLALATLATAAVLYFIPLLLLAMTGPFLVRLLTTDVRQVGESAGRLNAISTLGSFVGTVLIGYVLIPLLPNSRTMLGTALVLALQAALYFAIWGRRDSGSGRSVVTALVALLTVVGAGWASARYGDQAGRDFLFSGVRFTERARENSNYGMLQVIERTDGRLRLYLNDSLCQNTYDFKLRQSYSAFTYLLHGLAVAYQPVIKDVLVIGVAVGIVPMQFARDGARVDAVEINPAVIPLAEKWFDLEPKKMNLIVSDGRQFVNAAPAAKYDVVVLDAFLGDSSPNHLMTREAFAGIHRVLKPDGILVINAFGYFKPGKDFFAASLYNTLKTVFGEVRIHTKDGGNLYYAASDRKPLVFVQPPDTSKVHPAIREEVETCFFNTAEITPGLHRTDSALDPLAGIVLTDDYNPAEFRDAANREGIRSGLTSALLGNH